MATTTPYTLLDLTADPIDHLSTLPSEILQLICSYLFPTHDADRAMRKQSQISPCLPRTLPDYQPDHPLALLDAACKRLHAEVNSFAHHFLYEHRQITKYKDFKTPKARAKQRPLKDLLQWSGKHCVFCGKKSERKAIIVNGYGCCDRCDKVQWPDKIKTRTLAKFTYDLKDHQLLPDRHHSCSCLLSKHPRIPKLRYGTYLTSNVPTTMFLREDVEKLAKLAHGNLKAHLDQRAEAREERKRKIEQKQEAKQAAEDEAELAGVTATKARAS